MVDVFLGALAGECSVPDDLPERLEGLVREAEEAWPDLRVPPEAFVAYVAERLGPGPVAEALDGLRGPDLYLACACARGDERAVATFDATFRAPVGAIARRFARQAIAAEDAIQNVWRRLLVAEGPAPPRISSYRGRGALAGWVRAAATRTLVDMSRQERGERRHRDDDDDALWRLPAPGGDPEIEHLKTTYAREFRAAFAAALDTLAPRQRNLLRHHFVHALAIDQIGALYRVHRSTAARWLVRAREELLAATRRELRSSLRVENDDLDSILRLIESRLDASLGRLLQTTGAPAGER